DWSLCGTGWRRTTSSTWPWRPPACTGNPCGMCSRTPPELMLVNARDVKQVPGRKTDCSDAAWICQLMEAGLLRGSFVPPKPQRALRTLTRYRKTQIQARADEVNRLHKALE